MNLTVHKWYKRIIPSMVIFCLLCNQLMASPDCPIVAANFSGLSEGTTVNNSTTGWYLNAANVSSSAIFWVKSNRLHAQELGGEGIWYSKVFSVSGYTDFQIATKITSEGDMNSSEYVKVYYKINGGAEILLDQRTGNFGTIDFVSPLLNGNNVQFVIRIYNYNNGGSQTSKYYIEDYRVFKEHGPCAGGAITVSASAGNGGVLTCTNASLSLTASSIASGVTYSWTGPNNFSSTAQNPAVTVAGTYTVVATNTSGSGSASVTVTENKAAPTVTATGGVLGCATSVNLNATSSVGNSLYSWSGPGSFSSTAQNPSVSTAGTYTVVVTNPANGCTTSKQVQVTAGTSTPTDFWVEDFTAANGTTSDSGTTPWTIENAAAGTFSVQNNEFMASFSAANEGVWKSGVVSIGAKSNVVISVNLKSGTAGSSDYLEDDDYIKVYYKLNGGAETLLFSDIAGLNGINNGTATAAVTSPALNGSTLQIVIRLRNSNSTERYYFDNVRLSGTNGGVAPLAVAVAGAVTCTGTAQLNATATNAVSSWSWTGPNNFTSTLQNPVVSAGGQYIVTANFTGGCSASLPVTVVENKTAPDVTANGGSLACFTSININASSSLTTAQYSWTGPNGFTSSGKNPAVTIAGTYTVTVTNPANGCTASQSVQVTPAYGAAANIWVEDFTAANGTVTDNGATAWSVQAPAAAVFSVNSNQFRVSNMGTTSESVWTSGSINIAGKTNVVIKTGVRSAVTGSGAMNETGEFADYVRFYYKLNNGAEVLFCEKRGSINSHSTTLTTVASGALTGSNVRIVVRARATGNDEFYYFDNVAVTGADQSNLSVIASANSAITCNNSSVTLSGNTATPGVSYSWAGPGGFASTLQNPVATIPGIYSLTVLDPSTGCSASDTALVSTSFVTVNIWSEDFPVNGISVDNDATPWSVQAPAGAVFAVNSNQFRASNTGTTSEGVWTSGPIDIAGKSNVIIKTGVRSSVTGGAVMNETGEFADYIRFYYKLNNGAEVLFSEKKGVINNHSTTLTTVSSGALTGSSVRIIVRSRASGNDEFYHFDNFAVTATGQSDLVVVAAASGFISCTNNTVPLTATSATPGISHNWTGPGGFISTLQNPVVSAAGIYLLTVTNPSTGCTATDTALVTGSQEVPANVAITSVPANAQLTCTTGNVSLTGSSSTPGVGYSWTGPSGFTSAVANPTVSTAGVYNLTVTHNISGCASLAQITVTLNNAPPSGVSAFASDKLTCFTSTVNINGTSSTPGAIFSWTGPNGFTSTAQSSPVTVPGTYQLKVTNPDNGCISNAVATVVENKTKPDITVSNTGPLTCSVFDVEIQGSSATADVDYSWTGPDGFASNSPVEMVFTPGDYVLTVLDLNNGCSSAATTTVEQDLTGCQRIMSAGAKTATVQPEIAAQTSKENNATSFTYKAYPNPFNDKVYVEFKAPQTAFVNVSVYNTQGACKKVLFNSTAQAGQLYKLPLEASTLPAGVYYCIIRINGVTHTLKMISLKK
jgi:hypothetical protein